MKALIFIIILLFSTVSIASFYPNLPPAELQEFIEDYIDFGLTADQRIFKQYVDITYEHGNPMENMTIAIKYAHCSIMWRQVLDILPGSDTLSHPQIASGIWRAIITAKLHVERSGGKPERTETYLIPMLLLIEQQRGQQEISVTPANIYTCTALDVTTFNGLRESGISPWAPVDWVLDPIPALPDDAFEPEVPEPGQVDS